MPLRRQKRPGGEQKTAEPEIRPSGSAQSGLIFIVLLGRPLGNRSLVMLVFLVFGTFMADPVPMMLRYP